MFCNACGKAIADDARFCAYCGVGVGGPHIQKKLMRTRSDRKIGGVCAGMGHYFDLDVIVVRLIWAFLTLISGIVPGIVVYVLAWIIVPQEPDAHAATATGSQTMTPVASGG
jgi:phage shock protein C